MATEDDVIDMLICFTIAATTVLIVDTTIKDDRSVITGTKFKLKLSEANKSGLSNLEMSFGTVAAKGVEIL